MAGVTKALEAQNQTVGSEPSSFVGASAELKAEPYYDEKTGKVIYPEGYTDIKEGTYPERSDVRDYLTEGERQGFLPQEGKEPTVDQERKAAEYIAKQRGWSLVRQSLVPSTDQYELGTGLAIGIL